MKIVTRLKDLPPEGGGISAYCPVCGKDINFRLASSLKWIVGDGDKEPYAVCSMKCAKQRMKERQ